MDTGESGWGMPAGDDKLIEEAPLAPALVLLRWVLTSELGTCLCVSRVGEEPVLLGLLPIHQAEYLSSQYPLESSNQAIGAQEAVSYTHLTLPTILRV